MCAAYEASVRVALDAEAERRMPVVVKGAEAFVLLHGEPQALGHLLDGEVAQPLEKETVYHIVCYLGCSILLHLLEQPLRYSWVLL